MALRPVFEWDGRKYHVGQLKVREVEALEVLLGCRYVEITPLGNMRHKVAIMRAFLASDLGPADVDKIIDGLSLDDVDKAWTTEEDDLPDMYDGAGLPTGVVPSTATS